MSEKKKQSRKMTIWLIAWIILFVLLLYAFYYLARPQVMPIKKVVVQGVSKPYQAEVKQTIRPLLTTGFLTLDLYKLMNNLEQIPWVGQVRIERRWPDTLSILIKPQQIVARWNQDWFLNQYGERLPQVSTIQNSDKLVHLSGPQGAGLKMLSYYQQFSRILSPIQRNIQQMKLKSDGDWQIILNNGLKVELGQQQILTRLQRFVKVYDKVFTSKKKQAKEVDLQYPSGMAVRWGSN